MQVIDLSGKKFGRWNVIRRARNDNNGDQLYWVCVCDCGKEKEVLGVSLREGKSKSCGCFLKDRLRETKTTHGLHNHRLYKIWGGMMTRCMNPKHGSYKDYGGRGVCVCERWYSVTNFYNDLIESYDAHVLSFGENQASLDRIDVNGNYEITNVRWATHSEQNSNKRINPLNTSGIKGVHLFNKEKGIWRAVIHVNKTRIDLGLYKSLEEAAQARALAEKTYWGERGESA